VDSKRLDAQSGHEFTLTALVPALAGANMIYGVGMIDAALAWDYASAYLQNEFLDMVLRVVDGITVNEETMSMDVIRDVGPGGEYISHDHTFARFRNQSNPTLMNRNTREAWEAAGSPDIVEKAYEKSMEVLASYTPEPREEAVQKDLDRIYADYEAAIAERTAAEKN